MFLQYYFQSLSSSYVAVTLVFGESFTRETTLFYNTTVSQNQRLTKTLLFVSAAAVFCWLPYVIVDCLTEVLEVPVPREVYFAVIMLNYSNSLFNPIIYALTVPDYRQSLGTCCPRRQAVDGTNIERENNWTDVRLRHMLRGSTSPAAADPSHPHLAFENESFETKLWSTLLDYLKIVYLTLNPLNP